MTTLLRLLALTFVLGVAACGEPEPGLWANTTTSEYASYCTIEFCDQIETSVEPECICPAKTTEDLHGARRHVRQVRHGV